MSRPMPSLIAQIFALLLFISAAPSFAQTVSDPQKDRLFERLAIAQTEMEGRAVEFEIWEYWTDAAPNEELKEKLTRGMQKRREFNLALAEDLFDEVVTAAPEYAEGWNQRAFARFLRGDLAGAQSDLEKTIALEPLHFGAYSGLYNVLVQQGRNAPALRFLQKAVAIHPWLKERGALPKDMRPAKKELQEL